MRRIAIVTTVAALLGCLVPTAGSAAAVRLPRSAAVATASAASLAGVSGALLATSGARARAAGGPMLVIRGAGDGHGVGMSQEGALGYAQHGYSYRQILAHYYSGTTIGSVPAGRKVRVLIGGAVKRIPLERYVRGVVAAEMPASWPMAALEAQAVATRTYALTAHAGPNFDVYSDSRSQVYEGKAAETPTSNAAVAATAGQVVTYDGQPAITYFFANSGGLTEGIQNAFPGSAPEPWLRGVPDPYDQGPLHRWTIRLTLAAAGARLAGLVRGSLRAIDVLQRGYSPRIVRVALVGSGGRSVISGPELAARLGLYSTWAYFYVSASHGLRAEPDLSHYRMPAGAPEAPPEAPTSPPPVAEGGGTQAGGGAVAGPGGGTGEGTSG